MTYINDWLFAPDEEIVLRQLEVRRRVCST